MLTTPSCNLIIIAKSMLLYYLLFAPPSVSPTDSNAVDIHDA